MTFADGTDLRVAEIGSKKGSAVHLVAGDGAELVVQLGPEPLDPGFDAERLAAIHFGERATTYCPTCQSDGRVYADRRRSRLLR